MLPFVAALVGSVFIQIGTNLSNDYSDARRGADTEERLGPVRVTAGGLMPPKRVLVGHLRGVRGRGGGRPLPGVGRRLGAAGGGRRLDPRRRPLHGWAASRTGTRASASCSCSSSSGWWRWSGSYYVQAEELRWEAYALAVPVGLLASAILVVNNVRDIDTDRRAGKRTLAVKLGRDRARLLYTAMVILAFAAPAATWAFGGLSAWLLLTLAALPLAPPLIETVSSRTDGPALNGALAGTGRLLAVFSLLLSAGVLLS